MALGSGEIYGAVENSDGVAFAIRDKDIVYPFLVTIEALQDAAKRNGIDPDSSLMEIWQANYDKIIEIATSTFDLPQAVEQYVIGTEELNAE